MYQSESVGKDPACRSRLHGIGFAVGAHLYEYAEMLWVTDGREDGHVAPRKDFSCSLRIGGIRFFESGA